MTTVAELADQSSAVAEERIQPAETPDQRRKPGFVLSAVGIESNDVRELLRTDGKGNLDLAGLRANEFEVTQDGRACDVDIILDVVGGELRRVVLGMGPIPPEYDQTPLTNTKLLPDAVSADGRTFRDGTGGLWKMVGEGRPLNPRNLTVLPGGIHVEGRRILFTDSADTVWQLLSRNENLSLDVPQRSIQPPEGRNGVRFALAETQGKGTGTPLIVPSSHVINGYDIGALDPDRFELRGDPNVVDLSVRIPVYRGEFGDRIRLSLGLHGGDLDLNHNIRRTELHNATLRPQDVHADGEEFDDSTGGHWRLFDEGRPLTTAPERLRGNVDAQHSDLFFTENDDEDEGNPTSWVLAHQTQSVNE